MKTFTEGLKTTFLEELRDTANVTLAARAAGISSGTAYKHRREDVLFAERWDEAIGEAVDLLEHEAHRRAFKGTQEPVYYQGMECGYVTKYSDGLATFLLKAHRPDKYRERSQVDSNVSGDFKLIVETGVPTAPVTPTPTDDLV